MGETRNTCRIFVENLENDHLVDREGYEGITLRWTIGEWHVKITDEWIVSNGGNFLGCYY
jgi:hypothetical protein